MKLIVVRSEFLRMKEKDICTTFYIHCLDKIESFTEIFFFDFTVDIGRRYVIFVVMSHF